MHLDKRKFRKKSCYLHISGGCAGAGGADVNCEGPVAMKVFRVRFLKRQNF